MRRDTLIVCLLLGLALSACAAASSPPAMRATNVPREVAALRPGDVQVVRVPFGDSRGLSEGDASVSFDEVVEDSRYPSGAACPWQGRVVVAGTLTIGEQDYPFTLGNLDAMEDAPSRTMAGPYTLRLAFVAPYPYISHRISRDEYMLTLLVSEAK